MLPKIWFIDSYTFMMILGFIMAFVIFELFFRKNLQEKASKIYYLEVSLLVAIIAGLAGAYLFQNLYNFIEDPNNYKWEWQLTFYGGIIGGVLGFFVMWFAWAKKHYKEGLSKLVIVTPGCITIAHGIGRIGCFMSGCCYGIETDKWYGVLFPGMSHKVIPTNLMEAIFLLLLSGALIFLAFKKQSKYCFPIYLISYGIWRFLIEFIRGDHRGEFIGNISPSQFWSILICVGGIVYLLLVLLLARKATQSKTARLTD